MSKKIFYLSSEVEPFANTYSLSEFSKKVCSRLHDLDDFDIRLNQPKYGYISERKYILREVIRLKDMMIDFSNRQESVNLKSGKTSRNFLFERVFIGAPSSIFSLKYNLPL